MYIMQVCNIAIISPILFVYIGGYLLGEYYIFSLNAYYFFFRSCCSIKRLLLYICKTIPSRYEVMQDGGSNTFCIKVFNSTVIKSVKSPHSLCSVRAEWDSKSKMSLVDWLLQNKQTNKNLWFVTQRS